MIQQNFEVNSDLGRRVVGAAAVCLSRRFGGCAHVHSPQIELPNWLIDAEFDNDYRKRENDYTH